MRRLFARKPLLTAILFEAALIPLALVIAGSVGVTPWRSFAWTLSAGIGALGATLPLVGLLVVLAQQRPGAFERLEEIVRSLLRRLFDGAAPGGVPLLALLAGFGEELLFRGVLQTALVAPFGAGGAVAVAALVFGLVHYVNALYFVVATLMGVYLGVLYQWTGNLLVPCLVHGLYDWVAIRLYIGRWL